MLGGGGSNIHSSLLLPNAASVASSFSLDDLDLAPGGSSCADLHASCAAWAPPPDGRCALCSRRYARMHEALRAIISRGRPAPALREPMLCGSGLA